MHSSALVDVNNPSDVRWVNVDKAAWKDRIDKETARYAFTKRGKRVPAEPLYEMFSARYYREYLPAISVQHLTDNSIEVNSGRELDEWMPLRLADGTLIGNRKQYQTSRHWKSFRTRCLEELPYECACGVNVSLNLHHKTYTRIGHEELTDVVWVCSGCHKAIHYGHDYYASSLGATSLQVATDNLLSNVRALKVNSYKFGLTFHEGWWYTARVKPLYRLAEGLAGLLTNEAVTKTSMEVNTLYRLLGRDLIYFYDSLNYFRYSENNY